MQPEVFVTIPDHTIGVVPGQSMPLRIHIYDVQPQSAWAIAQFIDPVGRGCGSVRDNFEITAGQHVLDLTWRPVFDGGPGIYWVEVLLELYGTNQRIVCSRPFHVVYPGQPLPGELCPVERDGPIRALHKFPEPRPDALRDAWDVIEASVQQLANGDGSYGGGSYEDVGEIDENTPSLVRANACATLSYILAWQTWGDERHADLARAGLDYLMRDQHESGAFLWWGIPEGTLNDTDNYYATGYGGLALTLGHEILEHPGALDAAVRGADWIAARPFTGNVNYDMFAGWFLPVLARLTGETQYMQFMVTRTEEAAFEGQNAGGAWPRHNFAHCYHSIIMLGLAMFYRELPDDHPFKPRLHTRMVMGANFMASLISGDGRCFSAWEYHQDEFFIDWRGRAGGSKELCMGIGCFAWRILDQCIDVDEQILAGLVQAACEHSRDSGGTANYVDHLQQFLAVTNMLCWIKEKQDHEAD